jgi:hypothetical protein
VLSLDWNEEPSVQIEQVRLKLAEFDLGSLQENRRTLEGLERRAKSVTGGDRWLPKIEGIEEDFRHLCRRIDTAREAVEAAATRLDSGESPEMSYAELRDLCTDLEQRLIDFNTQHSPQFEVIKSEINQQYQEDLSRQLGEEPSGEPLAPPPINRDEVMALNADNLKAAQNPGDQLNFWQHDDILFIGPGHPPEYTPLQGVTGLITVKTRGSLTSPGEIEVNGADDEDAFKAALREFSKKKIKFVY